MGNNCCLDNKNEKNIEIIAKINEDNQDLKDDDDSDLRQFRNTHNENEIEETPNQAPIPNYNLNPPQENNYNSIEDQEQEAIERQQEIALANQTPGCPYSDMEEPEDSNHNKMPIYDSQVTPGAPESGLPPQYVQVERIPIEALKSSPQKEDKSEKQQPLSDSNQNSSSKQPQNIQVLNIEASCSKESPQKQQVPTTINIQAFKESLPSQSSPSIQAMQNNYQNLQQQPQVNEYNNNDVIFQNKGNNVETYNQFLGFDDANNMQLGSMQIDSFNSNAFLSQNNGIFNQQPQFQLQQIQGLNYNQIPQNIQDINNNNSTLPMQGYSYA